MTDKYRTYCIDARITVVAQNETSAENLVDTILHGAFIYGCGEATYAQDHNMNYSRVFDFEIKEHHPNEITFPSIGHLVERLSQRTGILEGEIEEILDDIKEEATE